MWKRIKNEVLECIKLMPHAVAIIIGWELGKWLFF